MKSFLSFLFLGYLLVLLNLTLVNGQSCELWSEPDSLSDSQSDNYDAFLTKVREGNEYNYYVFWVRFLDALGTELVYEDYYEPGSGAQVYLSDEYFISNPQVISVADWYYPAPDTLAFIFYEAGSETHDIYYITMTPGGFSEPVAFATSPADETHLRVSQDGSMVWEEDGAIKYTRLSLDASGVHFVPTVTIDAGNCHNPDLQKGQTDFIAWEKGEPETPEIWYSQWDYENDEWSDPVVLFDDGMHSNPKFARGMDDWGGFGSVVVTDFLDSNSSYHFSFYDLYEYWETLSEFSQDFSMEPELFTVDIITDFWGGGFLAFTHDEGMGNRDIYSSDYQEAPPYFFGYCSIDSTPQSEHHPQLFMGPWFFDGFDLICIWETFRNGNRQLYTSRVPVIVGGVPEKNSRQEIQATIYPNPAGDFSWLTVECNAIAPLSITIYNSQGQAVRILREDISSIGKKSFRIQTDDFSSGIYFIRLETGDQQGSLTLVKK
jgi:hypothetical protein